MTPWYTDAEVDSLCEGLTQDAAKVRYLAGLGLHVQRKPNGKPLVLRAAAELVLSGHRLVESGEPPAQKPRPNREAYILQFGIGKRAAA